MAASMSYVGTNRKTRVMHAAMLPDQRAEENARAERLRQASRDIIEGPRLDKFGNVWIPSPCWEPIAVEEWKRRGGHFRKLEGKLFDAWKFPKGTLSLDDAKALYVQFFGPVIDRERCILNAAGFHTPAIE